MARHNMLTPLAVIQGNAQLLQRRLGRIDGIGEADLASLHRLGVAIERACRELAVVVDRLDEVDPRLSERDDSPRPQERGDGDE
jgi:signal transduction histidine kinase